MNYDPYRATTGVVGLPPNIPGNIVPILLEFDTNNPMESLRTLCSFNEIEKVKKVFDLYSDIIDIDVVNDYDITILMDVVLLELYEMTKLLIDFGANVNIRSRDGSTALHLAASNLKIVKLLLDAGADTNFKNALGLTALSQAEKFGYKNVLELLRMHKPNNICKIKNKSISDTPKCKASSSSSSSCKDDGFLINHNNKTSNIDDIKDVRLVSYFTNTGYYVGEGMSDTGLYFSGIYAIAKSDDLKINHIIEKNNIDDVDMPPLEIYDKNAKSWSIPEKNQSNKYLADEYLKKLIDEYDID